MKPIALFRPTFECLVDDVAKTITFADPEIGSKVVFDATTHYAIEQTAGSELRPILHAIEFEKQFHRLSGKPSPLMSGDLHDTTPAPNTTSGARRFFTSTALNRHLRGLADGLPALRDWAKDQGQRPVAWLPFDNWKYDGYYGTLQPSGWKFDKLDSTGWGIFKPDHTESRVLFSGAALGDDIALAHFTMLLAWASRSFYNSATGTLQKGWHGSHQQRARAWMLWLFGEAVLLGFDTADPEFVAKFLGAPPKVILRAMVEDMATKNPPRIGETGKADDRTAVAFNDGSGEVIADYPWHWGMLFAAVGWIDAAGIVTSKNWRNVVGTVTAIAGQICEVATRAGLVGYCVSPHSHFTQSSDLPVTDPANQSIDKANTLEKDKSHFYQLRPEVPGATNGYLIDTPRLADGELLAAGLTFLTWNDPTSPLRAFATAIVEIHPDPSASMKTYDDEARYLDVCYARS